MNLRMEALLHSCQDAGQFTCLDFRTVGSLVPDAPKIQVRHNVMQSKLENPVMKICLQFSSAGWSTK